MKHGQPIRPSTRLSWWLLISLLVTHQAPAEIKACHGKWSTRAPWLLPPLRIQMWQRGVTVSTSRRNYYREVEKGFSESGVMAFWSSHQKSAEKGTELKTGWIVSHLCLCHMTYELSVKSPFHRPLTTEGSLSFTGYCLLEFTSECLMLT